MLPGAVTMIPVYLIWNEVGKFTDGARVPAAHRREHAVPALGAEHVRQRLLHLPAAPVLPRDPARALRGRADRRRQLLLDVPADRAAAREAGADRRLHLRDAGEVVRPDHAADLPPRQRALHAAARPEDDPRPAGRGRRRRGPLGDHHGRHRVTVLPMVILFAIFQRYFIQGIATQGRKG